MEGGANFSFNGNEKEWKSIKILGAEYIISTLTIDNSWKILLSNLVEVWTETITTDIALARCQSLNLLLDLDSFNVNETLNAILRDIPKYATEKSLDEIQLESCIDGIAFKFTINLIKGSPQQFWKEITEPLCHSSMELHRRHEILLNLIKKKDEELTEYKLSGAQLTRKNIETLPYNEAVYEEEISIHSPELKDYVAAFKSMMKLHNELRNCESLLNNVREDLPHETRGDNCIKPDRVPKQENIEASEMTSNIDFRDNNELHPTNKIETAIKRSASCGSEVPETENIEVDEIRPSVSESIISLRIKGDRRKKLTVNNAANMSLSSREQPSEKPKRPKTAPNIYDFIA